MAQQIGDFLRTWLPALGQDHRSYVTVAIGCTGGQHRSVYCAEKVGAYIEENYSVKLALFHQEMKSFKFK